MLSCTHAPPNPRLRPTHTQQEQRLAAVSYARAHLAPWAPQHMPELQRVLAALVFGARTKLTTYKALFSEARWTSLLELFLRELYRLHALLPESALTVHLQVRGGGRGGGEAGARRSCCSVAKQPLSLWQCCAGVAERFVDHWCCVADLHNNTAQHIFISPCSTLHWGQALYFGQQGRVFRAPTFACMGYM